MSQSTSKDEALADEVTPSDIQMTPLRSIGFGHPEYQFIQAIMEMQKSLGEVNASVQALSKALDNTDKDLKESIHSLKSKVDDLVRWKTLILGGAITIGFLIGIFFAGSKFLSGMRIEFTPAREDHQAQQILSQPPAQSKQKNQ